MRALVKRWVESGRMDGAAETSPGQLQGSKRGRRAKWAHPAHTGEAPDVPGARFDSKRRTMRITRRMPTRTSCLAESLTPSIRALAAADPLRGLRDRQELGRRRGFAGNVERAALPWCPPFLRSTTGPNGPRHDPRGRRWTSFPDPVADPVPPSPIDANDQKALQCRAFAGSRRPDSNRRPLHYE